MTQPNELWLTRQQAALICGMSARYFDEALRPRLPVNAIRGSGITLRFNAPVVTAALVAFRIEQERPDADPLLSAGGSSDWLERYRKEAALTKRMERREKRGQLVERDSMAQLVRPLLSMIKDGIDKARRHFGNEVGDYFGEVITEIDEEGQRVLQRLSSTDGSSPDTAPLRVAAGRASCDFSNLNGG